MKSDTKKIILTVINIVIVIANLLLRELTGTDTGVMDVVGSAIITSLVPIV